MTRETIGGIPVTEESIEKWSDEAEAGYPVDMLRKRGRKPLGEGPATVVPVRMDASLLAELTELAESLDVSRSEAIREAVRRAVAAQ